MSALSLPPVLDLRAAALLWSQLCAARGQPLRISAAGVERIGGLCLQLLIAAEAQWSADGQAFAIEDMSPAYAEGVRLMVGGEAAPMESPA